MHLPPPNLKQPQQSYFQQLALETSCGGNSNAELKVKKRPRIALDRNALLSLAVIFIGVLLSVLVVGIYNSGAGAKALTDSEKVVLAPQGHKAAANESAAGTEKTEAELALAAEKGAKIIVYVSGAVQNPGVVEVPAKSRINDALKAAGGARADADLERINLAQNINDAEQIHVPKIGEQSPNHTVNTPDAAAQENGAANAESGAGAQNSAPQNLKINLNSATVAQLDQIPGIGPVTAQEIVSWRKKNGAFQSVEDLLQISGIGEKTLEKIRNYLSV